MAAYIHEATGKVINVSEGSIEHDSVDFDPAWKKATKKQADEYNQRVVGEVEAETARLSGGEGNDQA